MAIENTKAKINLLLVDDEEQFLESTTRILEDRGFNVTAVERGEKAVEAAGIQPFDLALVDLKMPGMDGEKTLEALKKEQKWMEVIMLTGYGSIKSAVICNRAGAYTYIQKPCEIDLLLEVLADAYKQKVMAVRKMPEHTINEILREEGADSPPAVLEKLKELDMEGPGPGFEE